MTGQKTNCRRILETEEIQKQNIYSTKKKGKPRTIIQTLRLAGKELLRNVRMMAARALEDTDLPIVVNANNMDSVLIAFDVDGTLINNDVPLAVQPVANEEIRSLLIFLSKFKNVKILVWSGGGELYARQVCSGLGLRKYVDYYASKIITPEDSWGVSTEHPKFKPDIAIDDIHECKLGKINLIVRQK